MEPLPGPKTTIQQYSTNQQIESAAWGADREIKCSLVVGLVPDGYRGRDLTQRRAGYSGGVGGARGGGFRHPQTRTGQRANDSPTLSASGTKRTQGRNNPIRGNPALGPWNPASPDRSQGGVRGGGGGGTYVLLVFQHFSHVPARRDTFTSDCRFFNACSTRRMHVSTAHNFLRPPFGTTPLLFV